MIVRADARALQLPQVLMYKEDARHTDAGAEQRFGTAGPGRMVSGNRVSAEYE